MERQYAGINVHGDKIEMFCGDAVGTVMAKDVIESGDQMAMLTWCVLWQLVTLNQSITKSQNQAQAQIEKMGDPQAMARDILAGLPGMPGKAPGA